MTETKNGNLKNQLELVTELKLISEEDARLAKNMLARGVDLATAPDNWFRQIETKVLKLSQDIRQSPYQHYLNGGSKPLTRSGHLDWRAKDSYRKMEAELVDLIEFQKEVKSRLTLDSAPDRILAALEAAFALLGIQSALQKGTVSSQVITAVNGSDDIRLCHAWSNLRISSDVEIDYRYLEERLGSIEAARVLSARIAEHAATIYYTSLGKKVEDVSVRQLRACDERWRDFDLLVDERPVDVKNARRSFSNPESYVQHCVPDFKTYRRTEVAICGVLSDYTSGEDLANIASRCQILGEVSISRIRSLYSWAHQRFGDILKLDGLWKPHYQPGWAFEFPDEHYSNRTRAINKIPALLERMRDIMPTGGRVPGWLLALSRNKVPAAGMVQPGLDAVVLKDLQLLDEAFGISRPSLFIFVMGLFLESIAKCKKPTQLEGALKRLLLISSDGEKWPLGLEDPQRYVFRLIECLAEIEEETFRRSYRFTAFRMSHPLILRGCREDGLWMSLIAYCGGWRRYPVDVRCGAAPLFFGRHLVCPGCGFLICEDCGFCSQKCERVDARQKTVAMEQKSEVERRRP